MKNYENLHTFVICAYKYEPYLKDCVKSLKRQTLNSEIIIASSTPTSEVEKIAKENNVRLAINKKTTGHINDFCFAYDEAHTKYVTLCHQDDIYYPDFAYKMVSKLEESKDPIIAFSNYNERRNDQTKKNNLLLWIKRIINFPLLFFKKSKRVRLFTLSLGNAICAPSVTYNKEVVKRPIKESDLKSNIDWDTFIDLAKMDGSFVYLSKPLLEHRIHENSTTTKVINNKIKQNEDLLMFKKFWPEWIAKILVKIYGSSEKSNNFKKKENRKMKWIMVALYLILTISGLILYKYGANKSFMFSVKAGTLNLEISLISLIGLLCYLLSFIIYIFVLPQFDLSYIMPITSAISYIGIFVLSFLVLKEKLAINGIIGAIIILFGIIIMNL